MERTSRQRGDGYVNLALLTDGLRAEREQGITIDVAYRYFPTPRRKFIIADTPGHEQYTRNMVTGASTADLALILVDARKGVLEQSRRHAFIASLLRIPHLVVCVNKMDLVDYSRGRLRRDPRRVLAAGPRSSRSHDLTFIPISALHGDNVVDRSQHMPWYDGTSLLYHLEHVHVASDRNLVDARFPVQWVVRPMSDEHHDYRGYAGEVASGVFRVGDEVVVLPVGDRDPHRRDGHLRRTARRGLPAALGHDAAGGRRGRVPRGHDLPPEQPSSRDARAGGDGVLDVRAPAPAVGPLPDQAHVAHRAGQGGRRPLPDRREHAAPRRVRRAACSSTRSAASACASSSPLFLDEYRRNRDTGSFILIDESTNDTVGAGMVL